MSAGTLIFLVLIGGALFAMFAMHRGSGSHGTGMGMGCGGHSYGSSEEHQHAHGTPDSDRPGDDTGDRPQTSQPARARHRGC